jgi:hypothetical protein
MNTRDEFCYQSTLLISALRNNIEDIMPFVMEALKFISKPSGEVVGEDDFLRSIEVSVQWLIKRSAVCGENKRFDLLAVRASTTF